MKNRLLENAISLWFIQIANYIVPFIILIHLTSAVGIEIYGVLAFSQGIITISTIFIDFGYDLSATNKISKNRHNKNYIDELIGGVLAIKFLLFLLCSLAIIVFYYANSKYASHGNIFLLSLFPLAMQSFAPLWFFQGIERMKYFAIASILSKIIFAITAISFIKSPEDYLLVPIFNGIGQLATLILSILFIYRLGYKIKKPSSRSIFYCFKFTQNFFVSRIAVASYMNGAIIVLGIIAQPAVVAVYSMAEQLYKALQAALGPVAAASYPYMAKEKDVALMLRLIFGIIALAFIGACAGYYLAPLFLKIFFNEVWTESLPVLNIFLISIVIHAGAIMTGYPLAAAIGKIEVANSSVVAGSIIYFVILGITFFLKAVSPVNLAIIMLISELSVFIHRAVVLLPIAIKRW